MLLLPMLESNFYCNCTFGNRGSIRARDDYEVLPNDGPWGGGHGMKACWDRGERERREREGGWEDKCQGEKEFRGEQKGWFGHKDDTGKCKPGSMKGASLSEPGKASCPMMGKKEGKPEKD